VPDGAVVRRPLERRRAHETARHRVQFNIEALGAAELLWELGGHDRPKLDDRIGLLALPTPGPNDDSSRVQGELGSIEEKNT
jgi:hypothetical protein